MIAVSGAAMAETDDGDEEGIPGRAREPETPLGPFDREARVEMLGRPGHGAAADVGDEAADEDDP